MMEPPKPKKTRHFGLHAFGVELVIGWPPSIIIRNWGEWKSGWYFTVGVGYKGFVFEFGNFHNMK